MYRKKIDLLAKHTLPVKGWEHPLPKVDEEDGKGKKNWMTKWKRERERLDTALALGTVLSRPIIFVRCGPS